MLTLRPYQAEAVDRLWDFLANYSGNPIVCMPTASGKSLAMAEFIRRAISEYPSTRLILATHIKELIEQNTAEIVNQWPDAPVGVYSASVGKKQMGQKILVAGVQSIYKKGLLVGACDFLIVDECHLVPRKGNSQYLKFIKDLKIANPYLRIIGFSATPYRLDSGLLTEGEDAIFTDICYDISIRDLIDQGYLSPLVTRPVETEFDVSGVRTRAGEFIDSQLQGVMDDEVKTRQAVDEICSFGRDRRSWIVFCSGVDHAEHVAEALRERGVETATVTGKTPKDERQSIINRFKRGEIRALTNANVLTTGFNARAVDLVAMLRPTQSAGLYTQMIGRGSRLSPETGKRDCIVLDFAGNIDRHGPVDAIKPKPKAKGGGDAPFKKCPECESECFAGVRLCPFCGFKFPEPEIRIETRASSSDVISKPDEPKWVGVSDVDYAVHNGPSGVPTLRVEHHLTSHLTAKEFVCLGHSGFPREKASRWWSSMGGKSPPPKNAEEGYERRSELRKPKRVDVRPDGRYLRIVNYELEE